MLPAPQRVNRPVLPSAEARRPRGWYQALAPQLVNSASRGRWTAVVAIGVALAGGCGTAPKPVPVQQPAAHTATETTQLDIHAQFQREAEPIAKQAVSGASWSASFEAKSTPKVVQHEQVQEVIADLGWDSELRCFVHHDAINAASMIHAMLQAAPANVEFQSITPYAFDRDGVVPMIGIRGIYQVQQDGILMTGDYKIMVIPRPEFPVWCFHDAAGYAQSFWRVTSEFAKSFKFEVRQKPASRSELWVLTLDDMHVGFSQHTTHLLAKGKVQRTSVSASFIPTAPGQLELEDRMSVVTSDASGTLLGGSYVTFQNGQAVMSLEIERTKQTYTYAGTIEANDVRGSFKSKQPLLTAHAFENRIKNLSKKPKQTSFEQWEYTPGIDAAQASRVIYDVTPEADKLVVVASVGQRAVTMHTNASGVVNQLEMPVGSRSVQSKLVEEAGTL